MIDDTIDPSHVDDVSEIIGRPLTAGMVNKITNISLESIRENKVDMTVYEYIKDKVKAVENYSQISTIKNYMAVLLTALKENWDSEVVTIHNKLWSGEERDYSQEDWNDLESKLLGWDNED